MSTDLTDTQRDALKAIAKADEHRDSDGFVSRLAALDREGHVIRSETIEALQEAGLVVVRDDGGADLWVKLTAGGTKAIAPKTTS